MSINYHGQENQPGTNHSCSGSGACMRDGGLRHRQAPVSRRTKMAYSSHPVKTLTKEIMMRKPKVSEAGKTTTRANLKRSISWFRELCTPLTSPRSVSSTCSRNSWVILRSATHSPARGIHATGVKKRSSIFLFNSDLPTSSVTAVILFEGCPIAL